MKTTCVESVHSCKCVDKPETLAVLAARAADALAQSIERLTEALTKTSATSNCRLLRDVQELLRQAVQCGAQAKADAAAPTCPVCGHKLTRLSAGHPRTFQCRYGAITVLHTRGYCKRCRKLRTPSDAALGLEETAGYSPAVQDMAALLASKMPAEEASVVLAHLTGVKLPRATLAREAQRQSERA